MVLARCALKKLKPSIISLFNVFSVAKSGLRSLRNVAARNSNL
jgi:hypothetical protein